MVAIIKEKKVGPTVEALLDDGISGANGGEVALVGEAKPEPEPEATPDGPVGDAVFELSELKPNASAVTELPAPPLPPPPPPVTVPAVFSAS